MLKSVGVVGAGQMGSGIAQVFAMNGFSVRLFDINEKSIEKGLTEIGKSLQKMFEKGKLQEHPPTVKERLKATTTLEHFCDCDLIVEAVPEDLELKTQIFKELDGIAQKSCVFASNTSSISITKLASCVTRKSQFIGMHFMNPVPIMSLVEIIKGHHTSQETLDTIQQLSAKIGKTSVIGADYPGFIVNRVLMPMVNEAFFALMEGVAAAQDIDTAMKLGTNQPMGPLTLADFIGLDTCYAILKTMFDGLGDGKYRPCPLLKKYVDSGDLGKKSGRGVFSYEK